ncbi:hypothetical protein ACFOHU_06855 [Ottowia pentelensis]|uniref:Uncharacterized protein n=1 Tax=Ottowia pentelensis TaxID=511108 RepID=A0ABV6PT83_9BURK
MADPQILTRRAPAAPDFKAAADTLYTLSADALGAIEMLASLALSEIDHGPGRLDGALIVRALSEIVYRASDAGNGVSCAAESVGLAHEDDQLRHLTRAAALEGRTWPTGGSAQ